MREIYDDINSLVSNAWENANLDELSTSTIIGGEILYRSIIYGIYAFYFYDNNKIITANYIGRDFEQLTKTNDLLKFNWQTIGKIHYIYSLAIKSTHTDDDYDKLENAIDNIVNEENLLYCDCYSRILRGMCNGVYQAIEFLHDTEVDF